MKTFKVFDLPESLLHKLDHIGFKSPTPIQEKAIPLALEGKDILGSAQTGTGKTGAFGIPLIAHLKNNKTGSALILLPTRELADQVNKAVRAFLGKDKIQTALLIGGDSIQKQINQLKARPRLIVGTPGRINDHLKRGTLKLNDVNFLVLDEVDRMLDMGFGIQLDEIAKYLTAEQRQTLMFSATMPKNIEKVAAKYLENPVRISVGESYQPAKNIKQENIKLSNEEKFPRLLEELKNRDGSIIIFMQTKRSADNMSDKLKKNGHLVDALHGDLRQSKRMRVVDNFKKGKFRILVATDVAARGLDIPHIEHVINHDLPSPDDYIHRIGRTARGEGSKGEALSFIGPADVRKWRDIQKFIDPNAEIEISNDNRKKKFSSSAKKQKRPFKFKDQKNKKHINSKQSHSKKFEKNKKNKKVA